MEKYSLRHTIQQGFNGLFYIFRKELKATIKDQGVLIFFLLVPLAYPLIYALSTPMKWFAKSPLL